MRVLIAVVTCHKFRDRADAQRATWAPEVTGADVRFFLGRGGPAQRADEVILDVDDNYHHLPAKVQAVYAWALAQDYDYVFKCDDDIFIAPRRLLASGFEYHDYVGRLRGPSGNFPYPYASGFSYWLSRKAMETVLTATPDDIAEDRFVGNTLGRAGIQCHADYRYAIVTAHRNAPSAPQGPLEGNAIITSGEHGPAEMREAHRLLNVKTQLASEPPKLPAGPLDRVDLQVKTFLRDGYLKHAVSGALSAMPEVRLIVVDDGRDSADKIRLYSYLRLRGHSCVWLPFDSGFGAKSNESLKHIRRPYVLIGSDDFDFGRSDVRAGVERMVRVLDNCPDIGVASGRVDGKPYEGLLSFDGRTCRETRGYRTIHAAYNECDLTVNYSLIRREVFNSVHWDSDVKIGGGEHAAFFIDVMRAGWRVCWVRDANVQQLPYTPQWQDPSYAGYRARARQPGRPCLKRRGVNRYICFDGRAEDC